MSNYGSLPGKAGGLPLPVKRNGIPGPSHSLCHRTADAEVTHTTGGPRRAELPCLARTRLGHFEERSFHALRLDDHYLP